MYLALDTETTGVDLWHGCKPFFVSLSWMQNRDLAMTDFYEWDVDPFTREPEIPAKDIAKLRQQIDRLPGALSEPVGRNSTTRQHPGRIVMHNAKFDVRALSLLGAEVPWDQVDDTLTASHCLRSDESHGLKDLALKYLDISDNDEKALKEATVEARRIGKQLGFDIARPQHPHWPSIKSVREGWWVFDTWLPRAVARHLWKVNGQREYCPDDVHPQEHSLECRWEKSGDKCTCRRPKGVPQHPWWTVLREYAVTDAERTLALALMYFGDRPWSEAKPRPKPLKGLAARAKTGVGPDSSQGALAEEGLTDIYRKRLALLPITYAMENRGVPIRTDRIKARRKEFIDWATESTAACEAVVRTLPYYKKELLPKEKELQAKAVKKAAKQKPSLFKEDDPAEALEEGEALIKANSVINLRSTLQLRTILFSKIRGLGLKPGRRAKTGFSTDKDTIKELRDTTDPEHPGFKFIHNLAIVRKAVKHVEYLDEYTAAASPVLTTLPFKPKRGNPLNDYQILRYGLNPTGSGTLRFTSGGGGGINIQNVSKLRDLVLQKDFNLRTVYCPLPGREFYSADYSNIELRVFAYSCGDKRLIKAFEDGWSVHLIVAEVLWPVEFAQCKKKDGTGECFKKIYESTLYQWTKNFVFALIYGAGMDKADRTAHQHGAYTKLRQRFPLIDKFMEAKNREAQTKGYITTLGGYRLWVPEDEPHVAVNYFCQGSAGWAIILAMLRVDAYLTNLNSTRSKMRDEYRPRNMRSQRPPDLESSMFGHHMIIQVHDELDFDFPVCNGTAKKPDPMNVMVCTELKKLMEQSGDDIGLPTPVEFERHVDSWAEGVKLAL